MLSPLEAQEYVEFKRMRRETEVMLTLKKLVTDASRREMDRSALKSACEFARRTQGSGILVSPVNVAAAKRQLAGSNVHIICIVGGTGETLPAVKRGEAKRAVRLGAEEIRLIPCYSALTGRNLSYLKREIKRVRRAAGRCSVILSLEDHALTEEEIAFGVRAACEGGANGVCVRGEAELLLRALELGAGKVFADCSGVENAEQVKLLLRAGASRLVSGNGVRIAEELYESIKT